jgi:hypothetical protein
VAQEFLSAEAFERQTEGRVIGFGTVDGRRIGWEEYFPGRRVRMAFADGRCWDGHWFAEGPAICFSYDGLAESGGPEKECWLIAPGEGALGEGALIARPADSLNPFETYRIERTDRPLPCPGPETGV